MKIEIQPTQEQIEIWIQKHVPEKDMFFIEEQDLATFAEYIDETLVIPRKEFVQHSTYNTIQFINSFTTWRISKKAQFIIVSQPSWITNLPEHKRRELLGIQVKVERGLIFPLSLFSSVNDIPKEYIIEDNEENVVVIQSEMWRKLPCSIKENAMIAYAGEWDDWACYEVPEQAPLHLKRYANSFSTVSGSNCLATVLYAITEQDWIINEWVHPETFEFGLKKASYSFINDELRAGDVVAWVNDDETIVHASYHIGNQLFFNKEGQTYFNPWKIVNLDHLTDEWNEFQMRVYRKK